MTSRSAWARRAGAVCCGLPMDLQRCLPAKQPEGGPEHPKRSWPIMFTSLVPLAGTGGGTPCPSGCFRPCLVDAPPLPWRRCCCYWGETCPRPMSCLRAPGISSAMPQAVSPPFTSAPWPCMLAWRAGACLHMLTVVLPTLVTPCSTDGFPCPSYVLPKGSLHRPTATPSLDGLLVVGSSLACGLCHPAS